MFAELAHVPEEHCDGLRDQLIDRIKGRPDFHAQGIGGHYDGCRYDADTARMALDLCKRLGKNSSSSFWRYWDRKLESALNTGD